jgi:hypothetical protein
MEPERRAAGARTWPASNSPALREWPTRKAVTGRKGRHCQAEAGRPQRSLDEERQERAPSQHRALRHCANGQYERLSGAGKVGIVRLKQADLSGAWTKSGRSAHLVSAKTADTALRAIAKTLAVRHQSHSEHRRMRRPSSHRVV